MIDVRVIMTLIFDHAFAFPQKVSVCTTTTIKTTDPGINMDVYLNFEQLLSTQLHS